jgi:hypothetical protein
VRRAADEINRAGILEMLKLESPNLHETGLDRVIAYGHPWSPLYEVSRLLPIYSVPPNTEQSFNSTDMLSRSPLPSPSATATPSQSTWPTPQDSP